MNWVFLRCVLSLETPDSFLKKSMSINEVSGKLSLRKCSMIYTTLQPLSVRITCTSECPALPRLCEGKVWSQSPPSNYCWWCTQCDDRYALCLSRSHSLSVEQNWYKVTWDRALIGTDNLAFTICENHWLIHILECIRASSTDEWMKWSLRFEVNLRDLWAFSCQ